MGGSLSFNKNSLKLAFLCGVGLVFFENSGIYRAEMAEKSPGKGKGFFMGRVFTDTSP